MHGLELQFNQAVSAVETLGALARQSGGTIPNFQKVAAEMLAAHRGLASLELQPGGVVNDIVPRAGNERALGLNVLNHPAYGPGANASIQKRAFTLTGPVALYRGDAGIVARMPIFVGHATAATPSGALWRPRCGCLRRWPWRGWTTWRRQVTITDLRAGLRRRETGDHCRARWFV